MIKYFIRTTGERVLDSSISKELGEDYTLLIDTEHKPTKSFIEHLEIISDYDAVLLEDDVILCKNFKNRIEKVISEYPDNVINFFTRPKLYFKTVFSKNSFNFNQCTYYPKNISKLISKEMLKYINWKQGYDVLENFALINLKIPHLQYRPCLVQHIDDNSLQSFKYLEPRRSPYFIDYLDELGISYEEASKADNQIKLRNLMIEKFKNI